MYMYTVYSTRLTYVMTRTYMHVQDSSFQMNPSLARLTLCSGWKSRLPRSCADTVAPCDLRRWIVHGIDRSAPRATPAETARRICMHARPSLLACGTSEVMAATYRRLHWRGGGKHILPPYYENVIFWLVDITFDCLCYLKILYKFYFFIICFIIRCF
jgi:hypothetical protein